MLAYVSIEVLSLGMHLHLPQRYFYTSLKNEAPGPPVNGLYSQYNVSSQNVLFFICMIYCKGQAIQSCADMFLLFNC